MLHERFSTNRCGWFRWLFEQFQAPPNAAVLELGCGPGKLWRENADRIPMGWQVILSDFSPGMVAAARETVPHEAFSFVQADAQDLPFGDQTFNLIMANHMLYHVPDRPKALAEIVRVLKPDGQFYTATNGLAHIDEINQVMFRFSENHEVSQDGFNDSFSLENGEQQLEPFFSNIELQRFEDSMEVTEVAPLLEYVKSTIRYEASDADIEAVAAFVAQTIESKGHFYVTKDVGVFVCHC